MCVCLLYEVNFTNELEALRTKLKPYFKLFVKKGS